MEEVVLTHITMGNAILSGDVELIRALKKVGCPIGRGFSYAVGNIPLMELLYELGFPLEGRAVYEAIELRDKESIKWFYDRGFEFNESCLDLAVRLQSIEMIEFLLTLKCQWDDDTYRVAVSEGNLEIVKCLEKNGCPREDLVFLHAKKSRELKKYLLEREYPKIDFSEITPHHIQAIRDSKFCNEWLDSKIAFEAIHLVVPGEEPKKPLTRDETFEKYILPWFANY